MNFGIHRALSFALPEGLARSVKFETKMTFRHFCSRFWSQVFHPTWPEKNLRINIGCGPHLLPTWVNVDFIKVPGVLAWDCRRSLPFRDASASMIFAEHFFEHLERPQETSVFLRECLRCLQPGGTVRLVVPDAGKYLQRYCEPGWDGLVEMRPLKPEGQEYRDTWLNDTYATKMEMINAVFRQWGQHKYAYDAETLQLTMKQAGFSQVTQCQYGKSTNGLAPPDRIERQPESLYVEGTK